MAPILSYRDNMFYVGFCCRRYNIMKNKTLTKNMPYVKWKAIPPIKGPDSQGVKYGNNKKDASVLKEPLGKNKRVL
jgi:hypothetical protein